MIKAIKHQMGNVVAVTIAFIVGAAVGVSISFVMDDSYESSQTRLTQQSSNVTELGRIEDGYPPGSTDHVNSPRNTDISFDLHDILKLDTKFERNRVAYNLLAILNEDQLVGLLDESNDLESHLRTEIQAIILERLVFIDPELAAARAWSLHPDLAANVYVQWSRSDLESAIESAKTLDDERKKNEVIQEIVDARPDLSREELVSIGGLLGNSQLVGNQLDASIRDTQLSNPKQTWYEIIEEAQYDRSQLGWLHTLARTWFESDGLESITQLNSTLTNPEARNSILGSILHMGVNSDPAGTFAKALELDDETSDRVALATARIWADLDPIAALDSVFALETSDFRQSLIAAIVDTWSKANPYGLLENLDALPADLHPIGVELATRSIARFSPSDAADLFGGLADSSDRREIAREIVSEWVHQDSNAALAWVQNEVEIAAFREDLIKTVLASLTIRNPENAMETAFSLPITTGSNKPGPEVSVIAQTASNNLPKAIELLPRVREGISRLNAFAIVGGALIADGNPTDALELADDLPEPLQDKFYFFAVGTWANRDPNGLLNSIDQLPSPKIKSRAAAMLTFLDKFESSMTDEQLDHLKVYLNEEDSKLLTVGGSGLLNEVLDLGNSSD